MTTHQPSICVDNVSKVFLLDPARPSSFQGMFLDILHGRRQQRPQPLDALRDVSFTVAQGETIGLIGQNGSGKSTCLKLLARILDPTSGTVTVTGRVSALLELGTGFQPELTGRENIYLYGSVLGVTRRELSARFDDIIGFAELERFVDVPVKFYSSGMYVRLGFATAISVQPDVLLIDEVLAVGDQAFQAKCLQRIIDLQAEGVTIVLVSHDLHTIETLCSRAIWFDRGRLVSDGSAKDTISLYMQELYGRGLLHTLPEGESLDAQQPMSGADLTSTLPTAPAANAAVDRPPTRRGSQVARLVNVTFHDAEGASTMCLETRCRCSLELCYEADEPIPEPAFGYAVRTLDGLLLTGTNTALCGAGIGPLAGRGRITFMMPDLNLAPGTYLLSVALHSADEQQAYDYQDDAYAFTVWGERATAKGEGLMFIPGEWTHEPLIGGADAHQEAVR